MIPTQQTTTLKVVPVALRPQGQGNKSKVTRSIGTLFAPYSTPVRRITLRVKPGNQLIINTRQKRTLTRLAPHHPLRTAKSATLFHTTTASRTFVPFVTSYASSSSFSSFFLHPSTLPSERHTLPRY